MRESPKEESDQAFIERLKRLGEDWRFSDEFIGLVVRARFPRQRPRGGREREPAEQAQEEDLSPEERRIWAGDLAREYGLDDLI